MAAENGEVLQTNKAAISHWINGTRRPTGRIPQYLAEALSRRTGRTITPRELGLQDNDTAFAATGDPVAAATDLGRADVERRRFLAVAAFTTVGVTMPLGYDHEATSRLLRARTGQAAIGEEDVAVVRPTPGAHPVHMRAEKGHDPRKTLNTFPQVTALCGAKHQGRKPHL